MLKFGLEFVPQEPVLDLIKYARMAESLGFDSLWITDHYNNRGAYSTLAAIALNTTRMDLGIGVTNPYTRNIAITASEVATLNEIAGGRAILGIGAGDRATFNSLGIEWNRPLTMVKEGVEVLRKLLAGERAEYEGEMLKVAGKLNFRPEGETRIYIGAQGPKMLALAGRVADGVLINAAHPKDVEFALKAVANPKIDTAVYASVSVDREEKTARAAAVPPVAFIVAGSRPDILDRHGIDPGKASEMSRLLGAGRFKDAFSLVEDKMIDAFSVSGVPDQVAEKVKAFAKRGVKHFISGSPLGAKKGQAIGLLGEIKEHISGEKAPEAGSTAWDIYVNNLFR